MAEDSTMAANARRIAEIDRQRSALNAQLDTLNDERTQLESALLAAWGEEGMSSIRVDGATVSLRRDLWAGLVRNEQGSNADALSALKRARLGSFVNETVNTQTLSAWARELPRDNDDMPILPSSLRERINVSEKFSIRTAFARGGK